VGPGASPKASEPHAERGPLLARVGALRRAWLPSAAALIIAAVLLALLVKPTPPPPKQVMSNFETHNSANIVRDCGFSQPLPGDPARSLWLFCDTDIYGFNSARRWTRSRIIDGSTAAEGPVTPGKTPDGLSEVAKPGSGVRAIPNDDAPEQFLPTPSGLHTSAGLSCDQANGAYAASWISGVTADAARRADVLISFNNVCVSISSGRAEVEGFGLTEYDPASNTLASPVTVFMTANGQPMAAQEVLGSPIFFGGDLYLFGSRCAEVYDATCLPNRGNAVYLARVPANSASWANAASYRWYAGQSAWTATARGAASIFSGSRPLETSVENFSDVGKGLVLIEQTNDVGAFTVYRAARPAGDWVKTTSASLPCTSEGVSFCRAIIGHPELSTGSDLLVTYFNPGAGPYYNRGAGPEGHVMAAVVAW
jgi:hypothetical protein